MAIGDSTTEGLDDPDGRGGYRGWANRLAERIAEVQGSVLYANLGIRGLTTRRILDTQLAPALEMRPDLATVVSGTNDLMAMTFDARSFAADAGRMQRALIDQGAVVLTFTLPDVSRVMPAARLIRTRLHRMNDALRETCAKTGARLVDFAAMPAAVDVRLWSDDRLHANSLGHERMAAALAHIAEIPGATDVWREWSGEPPPRSLGDLLRAELAWGRRHFAPWVWRHVRGKSSGDGLGPKRPGLAEISRPASS